MPPLPPANNVSPEGAPGAAPTTAPAAASARGAAPRRHPANPADALDACRFHVSLDTTSNCNLKCTHCWMDAVRAQGFGFANSVMPFELFAKICGEFVGRCRSFGVSCGYEPLLNKEFPRYVRHAVEVGLPDVHFYTNGTLLRPDAARELVEAGTRRIVFSLEGATQETFGDIRRGAQLQQFLGAIDMLHAAKRALGRTTPTIRLNWVVMPRNLDELPALAELAAAHGVQEVYLLPHIRWAETTLQQPAVLDLGLDVVNDKLVAFERACAAQGIVVINEMMLAVTPELQTATPTESSAPNAAGAPARRGLGLRRRLRALLGLGGLGGPAPGPAPALAGGALEPLCKQPWEIMLIGCEGTIMPCTGVLVDRSYGDFKAHTLAEMWESAPFRALRAGLKGEAAPCGHCESCPHFGDHAAESLYHAPRPLDAALLAAAWPNIVDRRPAASSSS